MQDQYDEDDTKLPLKEVASSKLVGFVMGHVNEWKQDFETNYHPKWNELERLSRGEFASQDRDRKSERSTVVTPATQQAVEQYVSEMSEAVFGNGSFFDIEDDQEGINPDVEQTRRFLEKEFKANKARKAVDAAIHNGAIMDVGYAEIVVKKIDSRKPAERRASFDSGVTAIGAISKDKTVVQVISRDPRTVFFDLSAESLDDSIGVAIRNDVPRHIIEEAMEAGEYAKKEVWPTRTHEMADENKAQRHQPESAKLTRYFGKVPRALLVAAEAELNDEEPVYESAEDELAAAVGQSNAIEYDYTDMIEAVIVIANDGTLIKANENPWMMQDRPIVFFTPEPSPNQVIGRGIASKGYNMQKAADAAVRMHLDAMAFVAAPVFAMDSTRIPRGMNFDIYPGRNIMVNGVPQDFMQRMDLGTVDRVLLESSNMFERMLLQATGTIDAAGMVSSQDPNQRGASLAIALAGIIKRHKRALTSFQEDFVIPLVQKVAWRYMQFAADDIKSQDYEFIPMGTLGMVAREYEQQMLVAMLSTLGPDSPIVPLVLASVLEMSSLKNRETLVQQLRQMAEGDPKQKQLEEIAQQLELREKTAEVENKEIEVDKTKAEVQKILKETELEPFVVQAKVAAALSNNLDADPGDKDFQRRMELSDRLIKSEELDIKRTDQVLKERDSIRNFEITQMQMNDKTNKGD